MPKPSKLKVEDLDSRIQREITITQVLPRSVEYVLGAMEGARYETFQISSGCSYLMGTPQFDAYFSGYEAGRLLARTLQLLDRGPEGAV